jgi:hypothetical protein
MEQRADRLMKYLFARVGDGGAFTEADIVGPALVAEDRVHALMHAPTFLGDVRKALHDLAGAYAARLEM